MTKKEFISNIKRFKRSRQLEETIIGVKCQPIDIVGSNKWIWGLFKWVAK